MNAIRLASISKKLVAFLILLCVAAGIFLYLRFSKRETYFDFAKRSDLSEVHFGGIRVILPGEDAIDPALVQNSQLQLLVGGKTNEVRRSFYRLERRNFFFQKKRVLFLEHPGTTLEYYLKIPDNARLDYGIFVEGSYSGETANIAYRIRFEDAEGHSFNVSKDFELKTSTNLPSRQRLRNHLSGLAGRVCRITFSISSDKKLPRGLRVGWFAPQLTVPANQDSVYENIRHQVASQTRQLRTLNRKKNLVIFLLDASNKKHYGIYGYNRNTTPNIDRLARQGIVFDQATCQSVYTLASTGDLFTATNSLIHGVVNKKMTLSEQFVTLPEILLERGFKTAAFVANANASSTFGYDQGFDDMFELFRVKGGKALLAEKFIPPVSDWLRKNRDDRFFLYIHFREPHLPLIPPDRFRTMFDPDYTGSIEGIFPVINKINSGELKPDARDIDHLIALYDGNLAYVDSVVGKILDELHRLRLAEDTIVLILSDHGEALWEHGYQGHNILLHEEIVQIPMILNISRNGLPVRQRVDQLVRTIDVTPTILDLFGIGSKANPFSEGNSFLPYLLSSRTDPDSMVVSHTNDHSGFSLRTARYKYVRYSGSGETLYDLRTDPSESRNLIHQHALLASYFRLQLKKYMIDQSERLRAYGIRRVQPTEIDEETKENLKALGYVN